MRNRFLTIIVLVWLPHSAAAQPDRFWYNATCRNRTLASLEGYLDDHVFLRVTDGQSICVPFNRLATSDLLYLDAVDDAVEAAIHVSVASYPAPSEKRYLSQLVEKNKLDPATLRSLAEAFADHRLDYIDETDSRQRDRESIRRAFADRKLDDIRTRWVAVNRAQYRIVRADVAKNGTGLSFLTVHTDHGEVALNPADVDGSVSILPICWDQQIFAPGLFVPGLATTTREKVYSKGHIWEYELVYSEVAGMWTDPEIAAAHERIASSREQFARWPYENQLSEAAWNFHRANSIVTAATGVNWEKSFPWLDGNWAQPKQLSLALDHYTRSLELVPNWGEALLRRAAIFEGMQQLRTALDDVQSFRALKNFMPRLPITGRSADDLSHHANVIQSRIFSQFGEHYTAIRFGQQALDAKVDVAKSAGLLLHVVREADAAAAFWAPSTPGATLENRIDAAVAALRSVANLSPAAGQKNTAKLVLNGILPKGTNHFSAERALAFKKNGVLEALLAARTAAKYSTPELRPAGAVPAVKQFGARAETSRSEARFKERQFYAAMLLAKNAVSEHSTDKAREQFDECLKAHASVTFGLGF